MALSTSARNKLQTALCSYDVADEVADAIDANTALVDATAGVVSASNGVIVDANKDIGDFRNLDAQNFDAGASGTAGTVDIFPATASKGKFILSCDNQDGDTTVTLKPAAMGQAAVVSIPDPGAATANVMLTSAANDGAVVTATASELNQLDGTILTDMTPGTGISGGTGTVCEHRVTKVGGLYKTEIFIDLTGLADDDAAADIIGKPDGTANCHLGQITNAVNGSIIGGRITCLETPATGDPDIDLYCGGLTTGAQGANINTADASGTPTILINHGDWTAGDLDELSAMPVVDEYLYLAVGADVPENGTYTAGKLLIELWGVAAS